MKKLARVISFLLLTFGVGRPAHSGAQVEPAPGSGPFEIRETTRGISSGAFPNSPNIFSRATVSELEVIYRGKPISVKSGTTSYSGFYEAWFLDGAPAPAALLALGGFYLVTEVDGHLQVKELSPEQDGIATLQWLDAADGQPLPEYLVSIRDRRGESRRLGGGSLLLLNHAVVLDTKALRAYPVRAPLYAEDVNDWALSGQRAVGLAPGKTAYVLNGERHTQGYEYEHALAVVDFASDKAYVVPYDRGQTHIESGWDVSPSWLLHYFRWTREPDGVERLGPRPDVARLPRIGVLTFSSSARGSTYHLDQVAPAMLPVLREFLGRELGAQVQAAGQTPVLATLLINHAPFTLRFEADSQSVVLDASTSTPATEGLLRRIAARFDAELAKGLHQSLFTAKP